MDNNIEYDLENWPFRWFGVWREYGLGYEKYPSAKKFVNYERNSKYNKERLLEYLTNGVNLVSTSRNCFPSPFTGEIKWGAISYLTDGKWIWLDDIVEYIDHHGLVIPETWYKEIEQNNFVIKEIKESQLEKLEWPPNGSEDVSSS